MHKLRFYRNEEYEIFKYIKKCNSLLFIRCREARIGENLTNNHFLRIDRFSISIPRMKNSAPSNFRPLLPSKIFCILFISSIYIYRPGAKITDSVITFQTVFNGSLI